MRRAAIYCRSSKDKAELGLDIQQKELHDFAARNGLDVVAEFSDMEISGSLDETARPGLRALLGALRESTRTWDTLLAVDTSRIARDQMIGIYVQRECEKNSVDLRFAKMDLDGGSAFGGMMLDVARAFDKLHARLSAEKGRAGSEANIAKGYRAGGKAPFGYTLAKEATGAVRGGEAVTKSRLVVDPKPAAMIKKFLAARADGVQRNVAARDAGMSSTAVSTLVAFERNALTYAGYTVWNMREKVKPTREDPRKTMRWRARSEWIVTDEPTHEALITRAQAEVILKQHEDDPARYKPRVRNDQQFLLSALLFTPDGQQWHGDSHDRAYRAGTKGKRINAPWIEGEVIKRLSDDFNDDAFLARVVKEAHDMADAIEGDPKAIDQEIARKQRQLNNLIDVVADTGDKAILVRIRQIEEEVSSLRQMKSEWAERSVLRQRLLDFSPDKVKVQLQMIGLERLFGGEMEIEREEADIRLDPNQLRKVLVTLVERIDLDAKDRKFVIHYKLPVAEMKTPMLSNSTGVNLASPRGFEPRFIP